MNDCLVLGSGRSGTSMVAGALASSGYFLGENLHPANNANPKGFFEDAEVNAVNEGMLALVLPRRIDRPLLRRLTAGRPEFGQRWVAELPLDVKLPPLPPQLRDRRDALLLRRPLLFKDPRFCYTLPYWRAALPEARFVCVFREPGRTARSIVKECAESESMRSLRLGGVRQALRVWTRMYEHVLRRFDEGGHWLFLHYDQVLDGSGREDLEEFLDATVDATFAEPALKRSRDDVDVPADARRVYDRLCALASGGGES